MSPIKKIRLLYDLLNIEGQCEFIFLPSFCLNSNIPRNSAYSRVKFFRVMSKNNPSALIVIPARFASSRFPGKPLALIKGKPMIQWVVEGVRSANLSTYVVTDDEQIERVVRSFGGQCLRIDDQVSTGSERVALAIDRFFTKESRPEFVLNVQGDEPLIRGDILRQLLQFHAQSSFDVTTLVKRRLQTDQGNNPNVVKALFSPLQGRCLGFSRALVPFYREENVGEKKHYFQHIGVYCYRLQALARFVALPNSSLEQIEQLEQMRALENGMTIGAQETDLELVGVDTPEDIARVEERWHGQA